jgi:K+-transporting ATPase A subunit
VDLVRCTLRILLPLSFVLALVLVWQGVPQNLHPYVHSTTVEGREQVIPQGPVASQEAIKEIGTGSQGSGQHGRSRLQPDQVARDRGDRQAAGRAPA